MPVSLTDTKSGRSSEALITSLSSRISVPEIARRLDIGRLAVYVMLEQGLLPGIRLGRRWIVTRHAFENWERTCGIRLDFKGELSIR
jgi:excisionase family DNA binding protein